ncbi:uncharacterized protein LOC6647254 [Drosophila willistoni]|uniref:uncharacterized protein LOC6647254 n=1 Tax=Drosophila willistoni TaxID=7260 RepID=UPI000C26D3C8|nr:uncharacterized protein LOC6647254 [Drosophila willistoni]
MYLRTLTVLITLCMMQEVFMQMRIPERSDTAQSYNCQNDVSGFAFNLSALSGYWYEAARVPNQDVLQCLNVSVPANISTENELDLDLKYISTVNGQWQSTEEIVSFPWNTTTQNGVFDLNYESELLSVKVTYKMIITDYNRFALMCGYATVSPVPLFKLFTRERELDPQLKTQILDQIEKYAGDVSSQIFWTMQSPDKCNSGIRHGIPNGFILLTSWSLALFALMWSKLKE